jgi:hypothetical protein
MGDYIKVPREMLERWLGAAEGDWYKIDSEWGPTEGGLEAAIANGRATEIAEMRALLVKSD